MLPNSIEGRALPYLQRIEALNADLETERGTYMQRARSLRDDIKEVISEAKEKDSVPVKALKGLVRYRELEKKQKAIGDGLDIDEASTFEQLLEALGDFGATELGQATLDLAKAREKGKKKGKAAEAAAGAQPDPDTVKRQTEAELAEQIDEIDRPFSERHRAAKETDGAAFDRPVEQVRGQIGDQPVSHTVV